MAPRRFTYVQEKLSLTKITVRTFPAGFDQTSELRYIHCRAKSLLKNVAFRQAAKHSAIDR
jgi:hypothetical protein